jgi:predicted aspartyl protease
MGHVWVEVRISNPITGRDVKTKALVDSGATFTVIPWEVCEKLNLIHRFLWYQYKVLHDGEQVGAPSTP